MRRRLLPPFLAVLGSAVALATMVGCSSSSDSGDSGKGGSTPKVASTPKLSSVTDQPLPIEAYLLSKDQTDQMDKAVVVLRQKCMQRFGLTYQDQSMQGAFQPKSITQFRYGVTDAEAVAVHGYKPAGSEKPVVKPSPQKMSPAATMVLTGTTDPKVKPGSAAAKGGQDYNGQKVPAGGCLGEADRKVGVSGPNRYGDAEIVVKVNTESWDKSYTDSRVRAVFAKWSQCMKEKGYTYADPMKAGDDPEWQKTVTATSREQQVASADVACKQKYNVLGIWYSVDVAYEKQMIEQNAEALAEVKKTIEKQLKLAAEIS
ncbi:hypothetical protein [Streptomyces sp. NPDC056821]|uniref:hypothetical protein n=1 Tax=unclassified Streptomyces TaxID=2593676 RepID=UPI003689B7A3